MRTSCDQRFAENFSLCEDFEDIPNKTESKVSKRLKNTELGQLEILISIESSSSKVDNLAGSNLGPCSSSKVIFSGEGSSMENAHEVQKVTERASYDTASLTSMSHM